MERKSSKEYWWSEGKVQVTKVAFKGILLSFLHGGELVLF